MSKTIYTLSLITGLALLFFSYYVEAKGDRTSKYLATALGLGIIYGATKFYKKK